MKVQIEILAYKIKVSEPMINDVYFIEQVGVEDNDLDFYIWSQNGYNGYEAGVGYKSLEAAIKHAKSIIKNYFLHRCEEAPKGW